MSTNDATLLERWRLRRDAEAFNEIVSRYADFVYTTCKRVLKNEVRQQPLDSFHGIIWAGRILQA